MTVQRVVNSKPKKILWPKGTGLQSWGSLRSELEGSSNLDGPCRIGASDVAAAMRVSQWKCPARLYYHLTGMHNSFHITESTAAGHALEPIIADRFMAYVPGDEQQSLYNWQNGHKVRKIRKANFFVTNPAYPHLFASLDYVPVGKVYSPISGELYAPMTPIENKSTSRGFRMNWGPEGIPLVYKIQLNTQMLQTNTHLGVFNVLVDGVNYELREYDRDDLLCEEIVTGTEMFAKVVEAGKQALRNARDAKSPEEAEEWMAYYDSIAPDPVGISDDVDLAAEMASASIDELVREATPEEDILMLKYLGAANMEKEMKAEKNKARASLIRSFGEFETIEGAHAKMVYKRGREDKKDYFKISEL